VVVIGAGVGVGTERGVVVGVAATGGAERVGGGSGGG